MATKKKTPAPTLPKIIDKPVLATSKGAGEWKKTSRWEERWRAANMQLKRDDTYRTRKIVLYNSDGGEFMRFTITELAFWRDFFARAHEIHSGKKRPQENGGSSEADG